MDNTFDKMFYSKGNYIAGIDESGVSDIAGPLIAACVILPKIDIHRDDLKIFDVDDSKNIPEKYRDKHAETIWQTAIGIGIGEVQPVEIDYLGRVRATSLAMHRAVCACKSIATGHAITPDYLMIDKFWNWPLDLPIEQKHIEQGDAKSLCIASASIIAKVYRDKIMLRLHDRFPYYGWISNKGYPCKDHYKGIDEHGVQMGIHRLKKWPFINNPSLPEDHAEWQKRRKQWIRATERQLQKEIGIQKESQNFKKKST
jgi:ribonuclease HII